MIRGIKIKLSSFKKSVRDDLMEAFKVINGISNYGRHLFNFSPKTGNLLSRQISKAMSTYQLDFFSHSFRTIAESDKKQK